MSFAFFRHTAAWLLLPALHAQADDAAVRLRDALDGNNPEHIEQAAEVYRQTAQADEDWLLRARAAAARLRGEDAAAMRDYAELLRRNPDHLRDRLDLAAVQFAARRWAEARQNFAAVSAQRGLPENVYANIGRFQAALARRTDWQLAAAVSPHYDANANNAAPPHCLHGIYCSRSRPQAAYGLAYRAAAAKLSPLPRGHNLLWRGQAQGLWYFPSAQSRYDALLVQGGAGWRWENRRNTLEIIPFYRLRFAGSHDFDGKPDRARRLLPYLHRRDTGVEAAYAHRFKGGLSARLGADYWRGRHREAAARRNNGTHAAAETLWTWQRGGMLLSAAYRYRRFRPQSGRVRPNAYRYHGVGAGWLQQWPQGWQTQVWLSAGVRRYRGTAAFSERARRDREWTAAVSAGREWRGLLPSVNVRYERTASNQAWAVQKKRLVWLEVEKRF